MVTHHIYLREDGSRVGFGEGKGDDTLFHTDKSVWAISKPGKGESYTLTDELYGLLIFQVQMAREHAERTADYLEKMKPDIFLGNFIQSDGSLSGAGILADFFNLTHNMDFEQTQPGRGLWILRDKPKFKCTAIELQLLYKSVCAAVDLTRRGLNGRLLFRGLDETEHSRGTAGMVVSRARKRGVDVFAPVRNLPRLGDDKIFANEDMMGWGNIHLNYYGIKNQNVNMPLTIVHEATHKFARTVDVNAPKSYSIRDGRLLRWEDAARNAAHYERFMGVDWSTAKKVEGKRVAYKGWGNSKDPKDVA